MAQPLRLEDYFPPSSELEAVSPAPDAAAILTNLRQHLATYADSVRRLETAAGRFSEGGTDLVAAARKVGSEFIEPAVTDLEAKERGLAADFLPAVKRAQQSLRQVVRSRLPEVRGRFAELLRRDQAARETALRALRETRWQLMAILAEREPEEGARDLRSLDDIAALFGDDEAATH